MIIRRLTTGLGLAALALAAKPAASEAQTARTHLGPRLTYNFDLESFGLGGQIGIPIARRLEFYPSFDGYFVDHGSAWALNADLKYRLTSDRSGEWFYVGGGLNISGFDAGDTDHTDAGVSLLAGIEPLRGRVHPFGEARLILGDGSSFQLAGGLNITLGRH